MCASSGLESGFELENELENEGDLDAEIERHYPFNALVNTLDATFFWLGSNFIASRTVLPVYVSHFTDSKWVLGFLSMVVSTGWLLPQIFTVEWVRRMPRKKAGVVNVGLFSERLPVVLLAPTTLLAISAPRWALVLFLLLFTWHVLGAGLVAVSWQDMLAKIIPVDRRGRFFGIANFGGAASGALGAAITAYLLNRYTFPYGYTICFALAAVFMFASWVSLSLTREPAQPIPAAEAEQEDGHRLWRVVRSDHNFLRYLVSQAFVNGGQMAVGFLAVYALQRWQMSEGQAGVFTISMLVGQSVAYLLFGPLADRRGHKMVLTIGGGLSVLAVTMALLAPTPIWFYGVFALVGASMAGFMLSGIMIAFEFGPPEVRPAYIGLNNTASGISSAIAPLIGSGLAGWVGYRGLFAVAALVGAVGVGLLGGWVRDPRHARAAQAGTSDV
ncbi:MAG TPA: MFS transporter [Chloroflexi bacterium]|nr:MFS transporter [Chloroflexota bacterium]